MKMDERREEGGEKERDERVERRNRNKEKEAGE